MFALGAGPVGLTAFPALCDPGALCRRVEGLSLLDVRDEPRSWELCRLKREVRLDVPRQDHFWSPLYMGFHQVYSLFGTDSSGKLLLTMWFRLLSTGMQRVVLASHLDGRRVHTIQLPSTGEVGPVRVIGSRAICAGFLHGMSGRRGVYTMDLNAAVAEWRLVSAFEEPNRFAEVSGSSTDTVWTEQDTIWCSSLESPQKRMIAKGDCPRISPDGKLFYYRNAAQQAVVCQWPSMASSTTLLSGKPVGKQAAWSPASNVILLDRTRLFIGLVAVSLPECREFSLGYIQSWGVVASRIWWVNWGDLGPAQLRSFKDRHGNDAG